MDVIHLDLCKTFDTVLQEILVPKQRDMDLTGGAVGG